MPGYLGMIGSKRRVSAQFTMFKGMGISEEKIAQVHNPIGLPIKGNAARNCSIDSCRAYFDKKNEKDRWKSADGIRL